MITEQLSKKQQNKKKLKQSIKIFVSILAAFFCISKARAQNPNKYIYSIHINEATIERGYEIKGFEDKFQVAVFPFVLSSPTRIELKNKTKIAMMEIENKLVMAAEQIVATTAEIEKNPKDWEINSDIYEFDLKDKTAYGGEKPFIVTLFYNNDTDKRQKIFYFDTGKQEWIPLPSTIMHNDKSVRAIIQLPYAKLAVFKHKETMALGVASWYKYRGCNCVANPDYPKGTKLKVTALHNNKSVIITVNDYGPDRSIFPERVIDLDVEAFKLLANKRAGVIDVKVEPVAEIYSYVFQKANHPTTKAPEINAKYAVLIDEPTGEILFEKDANTKTPIASITKLMTANIFMDLDVDMEKIITYTKEDNLEGSRLYVKNKETMKIDDLFYSMVVGSANNAAKSLVRNSGISENDFIELMNKKAINWKLNNTKFTDPSGLDTGNISTAYEAAKMAKNILKNFEMLKATTLKEYSFKTINTGVAHTIKSANKILFDDELYITGAKTGFINEAGYCLIAKGKNKNDGREIIGVVLGENTSVNRFEDMKKLLKWGLGD